MKFNQGQPGLRSALAVCLAGLFFLLAMGVALLGGSLKSGIEAVLDMVDFDRHLEGADLVITGEGRIDSQSVQGKVISGVARRTAPRS